MDFLRIPFYDLKSENLEFGPEFEKALTRILESGRFVLGAELTRFEQNLALYLGVPQVVGVKSGTDALFYGLKALGIGPKDEVITTPFTFPATVEAILRTGAQPVLADIEPETLCLSPSAVEEKISSRTRAIVLVHLFGNCADLDRFTALCQRNNIFLIEDAAQAIGATFGTKKLGSFGTIATFSFYPTKNLGALGNGGAIASSHLPIACPTSSRLDELQAAFLLVKLNHLDRWLARRRYLGARYRAALGRYVRIVGSAPASTVNYHQFALLTPHRDKLRNFLLAAGIQTMVYYPHPIHRQPEFASLFTDQSFPVAEKASREIVCLPIRHNLTDAEQDVIINKIEEFFARL
ncbi:MAG: DegT/DnrJ/EryC1/StrS family aminotransferase [candidate division WOR-3 bacterium]|jgi:dTDP-4-amino-4,6-dideoxygalactose transaminase|nr:DegT/DnrJ/EryC1/StrS family aminotransferase [candidate division WOR-3 bacterium]MCR4424426.1 DegT/DnrJ/EryC1/StrS family aminotransferase [candidate division WOR-3 bacterium]MDH7518244.1 DegT/DnrJ/EryC1/StrS family aminotransferase [bacterium]